MTPEQHFDEKVSQTGELIQNLKQQLQDLEEEAEEIREHRFDQLAKKIDIETSDVDIDKLKEFIQKPYLVNEQGEDEYQVIVPSFLDFQVGRLDRRVNNYNVFVVDKYTKWLHGVPEFLKDELEMDDESVFKVQGDVLEYDENEKDRVEADDDLTQHLDEVGEDKATIKQGSEFELIAELIEKGELPFTPQPVQEDDLREPEVSFELRGYQQDGFGTFMEQGHACFCWMTGAGKSFPSMYALDRLRYDEEDAKKAVVVQSRLTKQQWEEYFEEFAPRLKDEVEVVTYHSIDKLEGEYILIVYDEAHKLPADTFSKGATIPTKYRIGATASPYREDGRQNYVFALTGPPVGLDWEKTAELMQRTYHEVNVHIVDDPEDKVKRIQSILGQIGEKRTLIFSDSLDFGEKIADATGLSFVNGEDGENQLDRIHDALDEDGRVIVSRIGDHGFSRDDLEVVLEADFLYGSRRQQLQRTGRLFHGEGQRHDIFFTRGEFNKYQKRLYSLIEKGFDLNFVDQEEEIEVPEKYESRVDLDVDVESSKVESMAESNSSTAVHEDMDNIDFLKNDQIQEVIEDAMDGYSRVSDEDMWDTLLAIADSDDGMTHDDIEKLFEKSKSGSRYTKPFREGDPAILVSNRVNGQKRWDLNVESFKQIIEKHEERQQKKERINELKQDIGI